MLNFKGRIRELRDYYGMNKSDFAKKLNVAPSTISRYESGSIDVTVGAISEISNKLKINMAWLLGLDDNMYAEDVSYKKIPILGSFKKLPVFDFTNFDGFEVLRNTYKVDFCIKVKDESLIRAFIKSNTVVYFKKQDTAENGDIIAVLFEDNILIRRYYKYGKQIILKDEGVKSNQIETDTVMILGKAVNYLSEVE